MDRGTPPPLPSLALVVHIFLVFWVFLSGCKLQVAKIEFYKRNMFLESTWNCLRRRCTGLSQRSMRIFNWIEDLEKVLGERRIIYFQWQGIYFGQNFDLPPPHPREFILVFGDFYFCSQIILPVLFCVFFKGEIARPEYISLLQENCTCSFCTILPGNLPDPRACPLRTKDNLGYQYAVGVGFEQTCPWWEQRSCYNKTRPVLEVYMIYACWFLYIIWSHFLFFLLGFGHQSSF